ncbi:MAG: UDP-N-acetylmuramate dehydrogenase [Bacillota bacterium]|jgi:UDP-N-acetylmuramate dehydrogenase
MKVKADLEAITDVNSVLCQQAMSRYTSFQVGGPAEYLVMPRDYSQVAQIITYCNENGLKWYVMGKGTNLLVSDSGLEGVVMVLEANLAEVRVADTLIVAQAGASLPRVSSIARANCLTGLEFASGIPGTVGGAVVMNAGAYGGEMKDVVRRVLAVTPQGEFVTYCGGELEMGYRSSIFQSNGNVVLEVEMELAPGDCDEIAAKMQEYTRRRKEKQPLDKPSAGSTFRRPPGHYAGQLIESCQLRGERLGGAAVSEKHCGFIVNENKASAQDIYDLITLVKAKVKAKHDVDLQTEVKIWGKFKD